MEELVSVIMPTKDGHATIARAINSVLNQTYQQLELIIVSDFDSDKQKTIQVLKSYVDKRIRYIDSDKKVSASYLRNIGIKEARGKYIAFLDDDDEWGNLKIYKQVSFLQNNPEFRTVITDFIQYQNNKPIYYNTQSLDYTKEILQGNIKVAAGSNILSYKEEVDGINGFDDTFNGHQDLEFLIRLDQKNRVGHIQGYLLTIHGRSGRVATNTDILLENKIKFLEKFKDIIESYPNDIKNQIYARHWLQISRGYALEKNLIQSDVYLKKSLSYIKLKSIKWKIIPHESYFLIYYKNNITKLLNKLKRK